MFQNILNNFLEVKREYIRNFKPKNIIAEILPKESSYSFPINNNILVKLHQFVSSNPIYFKKIDILINNLKFTSYEGDVNEYYLNNKKYDTNYQPFYPTWMLSAFLLCLRIKELGFTELLDIGSGDGRIPFCGALLDLKSTGIELDTNLIELQMKLCKNTDTKFEIINDDASTYYYARHNFSRPCFLVSGLPEMGEMFVENLIQTTLKEKFELFGIVFLGSSLKRKFIHDTTNYGWGEIIRKSHLKKIEEINLPSHWTNDNNTETIYLITKKCL